jgi:hypothetical protein
VDALPPSRELFGRTVVDVAGHSLGRLEMVIRKPDDARLAVVRRGFVRRRRYFVSLDGAVFEGERIRVGARLEPVLQRRPRPAVQEGGPHHAA